MDAFSCEICELRFGESAANVPLAVPCGHTYCKSCLLQWERKEKSICPKCRKAFVGGVETLPHNYTLLRLFSSISTGSLSSIVAALRPATTAEELLAEADRLKASEERARTLIEAEDNREFFLEMLKMMKEKRAGVLSRLTLSQTTMAELTAKRDAAIFERIASITLELMNATEPTLRAVQEKIRAETEELERIDAHLEEQENMLAQIDARMRELTA